MVLLIHYFFNLTVYLHRVNRFTFGNAARFYHADSFDDSDAWHRRHLRMRRETFDGIERMVRETYLQSGRKLPQPGGRLKMTFRARVAMTIYYLADQQGFKSVADSFGFAKSGCIKVVTILSLFSYCVIQA